MEINTVMAVSKFVFQTIGKMNNQNLIKELKSSNQACIKQLDKLGQKVDSLILMDFKAAQKCLEDFQKANAFTKDSVAILQRIFIKYQGLPMKGKTDGIKNRAIVANAYLGLIILENAAKDKNEVLLARYIFHVFEADPSLGKKCFPEIHQKYFHSITAKSDKQATKDLDFLKKCSPSDGSSYDLSKEDMNQIAKLMNKYEVSVYISDWLTGLKALQSEMSKQSTFIKFFNAGTTMQTITIGQVIDKSIGPMNIDGDNFLETVERISVLSKKALVKALITLPTFTGANMFVNAIVRNFLVTTVIDALKAEIPVYAKEQGRRQTATEYLKIIDDDRRTNFLKS